MFGHAALVGLALLVLCIPIGIVTDLITGELESPVFLIPLGLGIFLTTVGWVMWGSWSATLDRYGDSLGTTAKLTLAGTATTVLGVVCFMGAGVPVLFHTGTEPPDSLIPVVIGLGGLGVFLVVGTIVGAAVYGGIALGGPRWWWVGALLSAGLFAAATGVALEALALTVPGVVALVVSLVGYRRALRSGLARGRPDAVESDAHRKHHDL